MFYDEFAFDLAELSDLEHRWYMLTAARALKRPFDYEAFKALAVRTFDFLFPFSEDDLSNDDYDDFVLYLPRYTLTLLFYINQFSHSSYTTKEHGAALWVASSFCDHAAKGWLRGYGIPLDEDRFDPYRSFVVEDPYSNKGKTTFIINADTFDLSEMI